MSTTFDVKSEPGRLIVKKDYTGSFYCMTWTLDFSYKFINLDIDLDMPKEIIRIIIEYECRVIHKFSLAYERPLSKPLTTFDGLLFWCYKWVTKESSSFPPTARLSEEQLFTANVLTQVILNDNQPLRITFGKKSRDTLNVDSIKTAISWIESYRENVPDNWRTDSGISFKESDVYKLIILDNCQELLEKNTKRVYITDPNGWEIISYLS